MKSEIFREYDIRGVIEKDITTETARAIGQGLVSYLEKQGEAKGTVLVGHDHRLSGPTLAESLIDGILNTGWNVLFIGTVPTPTYYYALATLNPQGGIMITASHNPPEYNGFKVNHGTVSLFGPQIQEIYALISEGEVIKEGTRGALRTIDVIPDYVTDVVSRISLKKPMKVVVDGGHGTAGITAPQIFDGIGCEIFPLYIEPDGTFPAHHPDPTVAENLVDLIAEVKKQNADFGVAYDGDSDRIGVVDEKGTIIWGDRLLALYSKDLLSRHPGAKVIFEVKCSLALSETIHAAGGVPIMYRTGHSIIKNKMKEENSLLAGEMSGHMFFGENYYGFDDAVYASVKLAQILSEIDKPFSEVMAEIPAYPSTPEIRIDCPEERKFALVSEVTELFRKTHDVIDIDGVRVIFEDGWGLIRCSNTQPILVLRFEARSEERLHEILNVFKEKLSRYAELDLSILGKSFS